MKVNDFAKAMKQGNLETFYIFTGDEKARMDRCIKALPYKKIQKVSSPEALVRAYASKDIFAGSKVVVYNGDDLGEQEINLLKKPSSNIAVVIMSKIDKRKKEFKAVANRIVEFEQMTTQALMTVFDEMVGIELDEKIVSAAISRCNGDLARVENECGKLRAVIRLGKTIDMQLIDEQITPNVEEVSFNLVNALALRDRTRAMKLVKEITITNENPIVILLLLYRQFRNILIIQGYKSEQPKDIAMKTGLNVNMIYAIKNNIGRYSMQELGEILSILYNTDLGVKRGEIYDMKVALDVAMIKILDI